MGCALLAHLLCSVGDGAVQLLACGGGGFGDRGRAAALHQVASQLPLGPAGAGLAEAVSRLRRVFLPQSAGGQVSLQAAACRAVSVPERSVTLCLLGQPSASHNAMRQPWRPNSHAMIRHNSTGKPHRAATNSRLEAKSSGLWPNTSRIAITASSSDSRRFGDDQGRMVLSMALGTWSRDQRRQ
jgi:hypothetical protein